MSSQQSASMPSARCLFKRDPHQSNTHAASCHAILHPAKRTTGLKAYQNANSPSHHQSFCEALHYRAHHNGLLRSAKQRDSTPQQKTPKRASNLKRISDSVYHTQVLYQWTIKPARLGAVLTVSTKLHMHKGKKNWFVMASTRGRPELSPLPPTVGK